MDLKVGQELRDLKETRVIWVLGDHKEVQEILDSQVNKDLLVARDLKVHRGQLVPTDSQYVFIVL